MWTMASLFDGSGGFPLSAALCGGRPVWASEIEPYPMEVTKARIPFMTHYGDVTAIDGAEVPPVDLITFGSPCQDLSTAGKGAGLAGERSGLFLQAIRIIKEMRQHELELHPDVPVSRRKCRFALWENVPGAFQSNKGSDFREVLTQLAKIADERADIPMPEDGKWHYSGCIMGTADGSDWSLAWRVLDAQFWGVPQRRRRIFLVADFGGSRAGEILFKREGLRRNFAEGTCEREDFARYLEEGLGECL